MIEQHLKLIRKIAWSFHRTSGIEWDELFAEASLGYLQARAAYRPGEIKETTWVYQCVEQHLIWFLVREERNKFIYLEDGWDFPVMQIPFFEIFDALSKDSQIIVKMIFKNPHRYLAKPSKMARGLVLSDLRKRKKWKWVRAWDAMKNIRLELNEMS